MPVNRHLNTSGDAGNVANWSLGHTPTDDELIVIARHAVPIPLTTGLDFSAKNFAGWKTERRCNVIIGDASNPLKCACDGSTDPGKIIHNGEAAFFLKAEHATKHIKEVEVSSPNMTLAMEVDDDGTHKILLLRLLKGYLKTSQSITALEHVEVGSLHNPDSDAVMLIDAHASNVVGRLLMNAGNVTLRKEATLIVKAGGNLVVAGAEPVVALYECGGRTEYNSTGTLTLGVVLNGVLDFTQNEGKAVTVTTLYGLEPGEILTHHAVTITNDETQPGVVSFNVSEGLA